MGQSMWQGMEGGLWPVAHKKLNSAYSHVSELSLDPPQPNLKMTAAPVGTTGCNL